MEDIIFFLALQMDDFAVTLLTLISRLYFQVHEYLRSKLCSLYENDCIFDKFECCWNGDDTAIMTGSYNNFFRMFDRNSRKEVTFEASREIAKPKTMLKPRKVPRFKESSKARNTAKSRALFGKKNIDYLK